MRRRDLLTLGMLGLGGLPLARAGAVGGRRFVFVVNYGGWDPLLVFAPLFDAEHVEMEADAAPATTGGIAWVDHPDRPSVRAFFERWHAETVVVNGILVPSVAHPPSLRALMTGSTTESGTGDWPALIAAGNVGRYVLPGVVFSGPSFPGPHGGVVCRSGRNGQLDRLLSGSFGAELDDPVPAPSAAAQSAVDRFVEARAATLVGRSGREGELHAAWSDAHTSALALREHQDRVLWGSTVTWDEQVTRAVEVLSADIAACVTLQFELWSWDTHASNDTYQSINFEGLFAGLGSLREQLEAAGLAEDTVVVVLSEMGRTPLHNGSGGRDHWPYTSAMLFGPGLAGDRVVGELDELYYGHPVDPLTGELSEVGETLTPSMIGATLLRLGGFDPEDALPGVEPLEGILA